MTFPPLLLPSAFIATLAVLAACGSSAPGSVYASSYDQKCHAASDCVPVLQGTVGCCGGECGAINAKAQASYAAALATAEQGLSCTGLECPEVACVSFPVACVSGKCAIAECAAGGVDTCKP